MAGAPGDIDGEIRQLCDPYPVFFHTNKTVTRVWKHSVVLSDGTRLPSQITIWTGGATALPLLYESDLSPEPGKWAPVNKKLQHVIYPNIFVAGDAARTHLPTSKQAYHALDMGKIVARNILRHYAGKPLKNFNPSSKPVLVSFGDLDTFLINQNIVIAGQAIAVLKEAVFQLVMTEFDPSGIFKKGIHTSDRVRTAAIKIATSMSFSPSSLAKLGRIRIIK